MYYTFDDYKQVIYMVREIVKDEEFLSKKSGQATLDDIQIANDLLETLEAHKDGCVGMAANMIGELKNIIVFYNGEIPMIMLNAKIIESSGKYTAEEGCLSLDGMRRALRFQNIKVRYKDINFKTQFRTYSGFTAQIVQHELDHVAGKII